MTGIFAERALAISVRACPSAAWAAKNGRVSNRVLWIWNLCGLALLINIVTIAVLSMPTPLRVFMHGPANTIVAELPFVWIPCVMVQAALFVHILVFRALRVPPPPRSR